MKVKDLKPKQGSVDIVVDVIDVGDAREFQKFGKAGRVANAIAKDETGDIKLTLWNEDIDKIKSGDKVHMTNGYVNEWQGEMQLTTGRMGRIEVIGKVDAGLTRESEPKIRENAAGKESKKDAEEELNVEEEDIEDSNDDEI